MIKGFSLKFVDIMVGIVLGLGFQWWPALHEPWQYIAFVFVYFDIVDYWIDYAPSLKKWPPKREIDVMLDIAIMFSLFLYIYATQLTILYFLAAFILFKVLDYFWLLSSKLEFRPTGSDGLFLDTWLKFNLMEAIITLALIITSLYYPAGSALVILSSYIGFRIMLRIVASFRYKKVHFA